MEVHHHSHAHGKKNWKSYFWEFIMLFLAVFCGFLAEYQLEHLIEKQKEKQFITSLVSDLKDDTTKINEYILREKRNVQMIDSLCVLIDNPAVAKENGDGVYYLARVGPRTAPFVNNSRTFDQLRNSGGFRLIHKSQTSNRIMDYYGQFSWIRLLEGNYTREFDFYKEAAARLIDPGIYRRQENENGSIRRSSDNPALLSYDPALLKQMEFYAVQMNGSRRSLIPLMQQLKQSAIELLSYLQDSYHID